MKVALFGAAVLALFLFTGWVWLIFVGLLIMLFGLMFFAYRRPQDDPVWKLLVRDKVIDDDD